MNDATIHPLLEDLKNTDQAVREQATQQLWRIWFQQKGEYGLDLIGRSQMLVNAGQLQAAEAVLTELINDQPDFGEAWNRRAVLYYTQNRYQEALEDCQATLRLIPYHFGALHGLGLCWAALGQYQEAIQSFRQALEIQPHAVENQRLILECTALLS